MRDVEVGVVGLGNMGSGIAGCFVRAGVSLAVWDTNQAALDPYRARDGIHVMIAINPHFRGSSCALAVTAIVDNQY